MRKFIILCTAVFMVGCAGMSVNKTTEVSIDTILALSSQVDDAEKRGWIDNETEDKLQNNLIDALKLLKNTYQVADVSACQEAEQKNQCIDDILEYVEITLRESAQ